MAATLRLATRQSPMAMWQAELIKQQLEQKHPNLTIEIQRFVTQGDKIQHKALSEIGGKDLFAKELQCALLDKKADFAVHCAKDLSAHTYPGLQIEAFYQRGDARDALVSNRYHSLAELPAGAVVGTASPRRQAVLLNCRPDLTTQLIRGNVNTRLRKLDEGDYDAIILAAAGLFRLSMEQRITEYLPVENFTPAIGQGVLALECRAGDQQTAQFCQELNDFNTAACVTAERAVNQLLHGDCHTPIGAYAHIQQDQLYLQALVGSLDGKQLIRAKASAAIDQAQAVGEQVGQQLLINGAKELLHG